MSNYVKTTNFTLKDSLPTGDPNKVVRGSEFDTEFNALQVASATKADLGSPTFTGTATFDNVTVTGTADLSGASVSIDINGGTIDNTVIGGTTPAAGTFTSLVSATADINGGTVDNVAIGATTASTGVFTSLVSATADINGGTIDGTVIGGSTPAAGTFAAVAGTTGTFSSAVSGTTGTFSGAVSGTTGTFSGAVTGSNLNIANWNTAYGWGNHATAGYLTSVAFNNIDAGAITTSSETFATSDTQLPTNAAVRDFMIDIYPTIVEINDLSAAVVWTTVPDAYISASSVNQHVTLEKATQTKTYANNETSTIALSAAITSGAPVVSVTKEVPQTGLTDNTWDVASDGANYDFENSAYSTTLTPSEASADGVFTLGSGSFAADDVGKIVSGNGGTAVIIKTDGSYNLLTNFTNTSAIASGSWTLKELVVDGDATGIALSSGTDEEGGVVYDLRNTIYTGSSFSVASQETNARGVAFNTDGTKMYMVGSNTDTVYQYTLSTAFALSTASYDSVSFSVSSQDTTPFDIVFSTDGTKMYMIGSATSSAYQYTLSTAFDLSTASYANKSFSVSSQDSSPRGIALSSDGTKMYFLGANSDSVYEYTLSTAFDVSTASYASVNLDASSQDTTPEGFAFNANGTKLYVAGSNTDAVYQYTLSTPWSLSTASYANLNANLANQTSLPEGIAFSSDGANMYIVNNADNSILQYSLDPRFNLEAADYTGTRTSISSQEGNPTGVVFNNDGTAMYIIGYTDNVYQYTLSTAFDTDTATYANKSFNLTSQVGYATGMSFNNDGTRMFILGDSADKIWQYTLSTAFDVSTSSYDNKSFSVATQETSPNGLTFNNDGTKMYIVGDWANSVHQYSLSTAFDISTASYDSVSFSVNSQDTSPTDVAFSSDGTRMFVVGFTNKKIYQYVLTTAFDVSTASYSQKTVPAPSLETSPQGMAFNNDGTKMYLVGFTDDAVYQWTMGGAFSLKTVEYSGDSFSVASQDTSPQGLVFNNDGTKMYIIGMSNDKIFQYSLSTAFDVSTASYANKSFSVVSQDNGPRSLAFNTDGSKMYIIGTGNDTVFQYSLSTAFDVSTASYASKSFSVTSQETTPLGLTFNNDGTKMYVIGFSASAYQYTLSTAFDVSTASYASKSFSVNSQEQYPFEINFNKDGTKMYIVGSNTSSAYQYTLSTAFDLSTASYDYVSLSTAGQDGNPDGITFNTDGTKMYIVGNNNDKVFQYDIGSTLVQIPVVYSSDYAVAVTNSGGQINTTYWADINSTTATEAVGTGEVYYAYSTDDHVTWKVIHNTTGQRSIVRDNSGTWQYNSNATYGSETWANATTNTEFAALRQAFSVAANKMDGTQMDAVADANHLTLADSLDFMIALKNADSTSTSPTSDGVALNYDGNVLNQGAVLGTDYNWDFPSSTSVRLTSLGAYNLKVRII